MTSEALRLYPILHRLMLVGDVTVSNPREALHDLGNSSKAGVGIVLVFREALETNWQPLLHRDNVKVC